MAIQRVGGGGGEEKAGMLFENIFEIHLREFKFKGQQKGIKINEHSII